MEIKRFKLSMLIWTIVLCSFIMLDMAFYQVFLKEGMFDKIKPILNSPIMAPMVKGFGVEFEKLTNVLGFYVIRNVPIIMLLTGIFSILNGTTIFANEEFEKTAEFLYTKPLTRTDIFISKSLTCFTLTTIINICVVIIGFVSLEIFKNSEYSRTTYFIHTIFGFLFSYLFAAAGFTLAVIAKRGRGLFPISVGIVLGTYFLDLISKTTKSAEFLGYISPFEYVDTNVLVSNYYIHTSNLLFFLLTTLILFIISFRIFLKKDILN